MSDINIASVKKQSVKPRLQPDLSDSVGARLQALRKKFGLSQRELARRADVTNSALSMIEQGKVSPSVGSLEKILHAFPISLQEFFAAPFELSPSVISAAEFVRVKKGQIEFRVLPLSMGKSLNGLCMTEQTFPPLAKVQSDWMINKGFIGGVVISGEIALHLDGVEHQLVEGDGFNFSLYRDHSFINIGNVDCRLVCVSFSET